MKVKLHIGVEVFGLIVTDVHVFTNEDECYDWYKGYVGLQHPNRHLIKPGMSMDMIHDICEQHYDEMGEDYQETKLFTVTVDIPEKIIEIPENEVINMEATRKKIQDYYDKGTIVCPVCDSTDLVAGIVNVRLGDMDDKDPKAKCQTTCGACGFQWWETFRLKFFSSE